MASTISEPRFSYVRRLGDTALVMGQRLGEWVGKAPQLEEEMALANFAIDYIGQARLLFAYAAQLSARPTDEDVLAFQRAELDYQNFLLVEQPNGNFADTIVRQFLFETYYELYLAALTSSSDPRLAEIAAKTRKEIRYHVAHVSDWLLRLGDGTEYSHSLTQRALQNLWRFSGELFEMDALDEEMLEVGVAPDVTALRDPWLARVKDTIESATLAIPENCHGTRGGKRGHHTECFGYLLAQMQAMQRTYSGLDW